MKKIFLITILFLDIFSHSGMCQIAYYDALKLEHWANKDLGDLEKNKDTIQAIANIISNYLDPADIDLKDAVRTINKIKTDNPFLTNYFIATDTKLRNQKIDFIQSQNERTNESPGLDISSIADGLAQFLIKRGKQELDVAFFSHMKTFLQNHIECSTLFPATTDFLSRIASYQYSELLQSLREAFQKDLDNLIVNLNLLIDLPKYQTILKNAPEIRIALRSAKIVSELSKGNSESISPKDLIHLLASIKDWGYLNQNLASGWKLLDLISQSLQSNPASDTKHWINFQEFNKLLDDPVALNLYLGLIYGKAKPIQFKLSSGTITVSEYMKSNSGKINLITDLFENFLSLANQIDKALCSLKGPIGSTSNTNYYNYINTVIQTLEYGFKVADIIKPGIISDPCIIIASNSNSLFQNISTKNYSAAIMNAYTIIDQIILVSNNQSTDLKIKAAAIRSQRNASPFEINQAHTYTLDAKKISDSASSSSKTVQFILKYGNLMAGIIKAQTPDEAESAIEAAVLPAGSSSIKKNTAWNIAINAYVGYSTGPRLSNASDSWNNNRGVTAPIGITFSRSLGEKLNFWFIKADHFNLGSISAFGTLLNVGSIVQYQLNDSGTGIKQQINLANIFSPGGYLVYGFFAHLPLSISYGWQYGPRIFKVAADNQGLSDKPGWRSNWNFTIDIPLANLFTVTFKQNNQKY